LFVFVDDQARDGPHVGDGRAVAQVREHRADIPLIADHEVPALPSHRHDAYPTTLLEQEPAAGPIDVGVQTACQAAIGRDVDDLDGFHGPAPQQRMDGVALFRLGRKIGENVPHAV
jgi:hypothetical protein